MPTKPTGVGSGRWNRDLMQPAARSASARKASKNSSWRYGPSCSGKRAAESYKSLKPRERKP